MAIGAIWHPPVDRPAYDQVKEKVFQASVDAGLRFHAAGEAQEGWRIIEVWDSRDGLDRFITDTLRPAIAEASGGQAPDFYPEVFDVHFEGP